MPLFLDWLNKINMITKQFSISTICLLGVLVLNLQAHAQKNYFKYKETVELTALDQPPAQPLSLWYNQPAQIWEDALPLGLSLIHI